MIPNHLQIENTVPLKIAAAAADTTHPLHAASVDYVDADAVWQKARAAYYATPEPERDPQPYLAADNRREKAFDAYLEARSHEE